MKTIRERVAAHPFCHNLKREDLDRLVECATEKTFEAGEVLFRKGELAGHFYLIESGEVVLETHETGAQPVPVQTVGAGEAVGWSWMFPPYIWHFHARATKPVSALVLNARHLLVTSEDEHQFGYELMKRIAKLVIQRLQATRRQLVNLQIESALHD